MNSWRSVPEGIALYVYGEIWKAVLKVYTQTQKGWDLIGRGLIKHRDERVPITLLRA